MNKRPFISCYNFKRSFLMPGKKVIAIHEKGRPVPRIVQPMERPVTPHGEARMLPSTERSSKLIKKEPRKKIEIGPLNTSQYFNIIQQLTNPSSQEEIKLAVQNFNSISTNLAENNNLSSYDLDAYQELHPLLVRLLENSSASIIYLIYSGLYHIRKCLVQQPALKVVMPSVAPPQNSPPRPVYTINTIKKTKLGPLEPKEDPQSQKVPVSQFNHFMAKILYKLSQDKANDSMFDNQDIIDVLLDIMTSSDKFQVRTFAAAASKNASHSVQFRSKLISSPHFNKIYTVFDISDPKAFQFLIQIAGLFRQLLNDQSNIVNLIENQLHTHIFCCMEHFAETPDFVYNCFRIMTKLVDSEIVLNDLITKFTAKKLLTFFFNLVQINIAQPLIVTRVSYVLAEFISLDENLSNIASELKPPYNVNVLTEAIQNEAISSNKEALSMLLHVIANLSINESNAKIFMRSSAFNSLYMQPKYDEPDKFGLNLLCVTSNLTYHDSKWCPQQLLDAIPISIISKNRYAIIEALRILCNLALVKNMALIKSQIPDLLVVLLGHSDIDIVIFAMQALTNLITYKEVKENFKKQKGFQKILKILQSELIDETVLEVLSTMIMNYDQLDSQQSKQILNNFEDFEYDQENQLFQDFKSYLQNRMDSS